jgi:hypothetical protein
LSADSGVAVDVGVGVVVWFHGHVGGGAAAAGALGVVGFEAVAGWRYFDPEAPIGPGSAPGGD